MYSRETTYPIIIDPTVVWLDSRLPCTLLSNDPLTTDQNFRIDRYFEIQNQGLTNGSGFNTEYMCFINTYYSPMSGKIEQLHGSKVEKANLYIVEYNMGNNYKPGTVEIIAPKKRWSVDTLTWNNHPELDEYVWAKFNTIGETGNKNNVDLTKWAQAVADGEILNNGLVLKAKELGTGAGFYGPSLQSLRHLQLEIIYYPYVAYVNHYYDNAYNIRYSQSKYGTVAPKDMLMKYQDWISSVYESLFGLKIISNYPELYFSLADECKLKQGLGMNISYLDKRCTRGNTHGYVDKNGFNYSECTDVLATHSEFVDKKISDINCCNVLWSGNQLYENGKPYNRAHFWRDSIFVYEPYETSGREDGEKRTIMHELAHNFGAPDEYCYDENVPAGGDCGVIGCPIHHPERFIGDCIMGYAMYDEDRISYPDNIFCEYCIEDITNHLKTHHKVSPFVVTPQAGETMGEAVIRTLDIVDEKTVEKLKITGNAVLNTSNKLNELGEILPNLKEVDLSGFRGELGKYSFYDCKNLETVILPTYIDLPSYTFANCLKLQTIYKNGNKKEIGTFDLSGVNLLGECTFKNTVEECVILPKDIEISNKCFEKCAELKYIFFDEAQEDKMLIGNETFYGVNESCVAYMSEKLVDDDDFTLRISDTCNVKKWLYPLIVIPNNGETMKQAITRTVGTKSTSKINKMIIKGNAIMSAGTSENDSASILPEMEKLDLSDFAGNLGKYAFHGCAKLESVIFPMENISLPTYAFSECTKLETLYKSGNEHKKGECDLTSVTSVGNYAFMNTAISRVKLPKTFRIPQYCFIACKNLSEIYKEGNSPIDRELDLSGVSNIGYGAFWNYYSVTMKYDTVKLSEQAAIEGNCFRNCWNLVTIYKNGKERRDNEADLSGITDLGEGYFLE